MNLPLHAKLSGPLTYLHTAPLKSGTLVRVPFGKKEVLGIVWFDSVACATPQDIECFGSQVNNSGASASEQHLSTTPSLKSISYVIEGIAELSASWLAMVQFAAAYYQRSLGEMALQALPAQLREMDAAQIARKLKAKKPNRETTQSKSAKSLKRSSLTYDVAQLTQLSQESHLGDARPHPLTPEQVLALNALQNNSGPFLIFGSTGSGKTEVYLQYAQEVLNQNPSAQILVMVPEINLTPQLEERFKSRFHSVNQDFSDLSVVCLHSAMTPAQRLRSWLGAHSGAARIILGTRMAVFASIPNLQLIVVDEEHDPSYKQQEGARYSARDLAVYRAKQLGIKVMLGSATPSLESWHNASQGHDASTSPRYHLIRMPSRVGQAQMPQLKLVDLNLQPKGTVFSAELLDAIKARIARGEQALILLNRRGYAPVLHCHHCDWKSNCLHCSAYRVFHKIDRTLRCHHCGVVERVPKHCPSCGNADISPLGKGTEQLEELLQSLTTDLRQPNGEAINILRIDADSTRLSGALSHQLAKVHSGEVNVLVGTQMIAKGHDFRKITLVVTLYPDTALFSSDFRAPERLFSLLLQAAGRAGRDSRLANSSPPEMWVQTYYPDHPLFQALRNYDYPHFAGQQLKERAQAHLPPYTFQALVRADAKSQLDAQQFLNAAAQQSKNVLARIKEIRLGSHAPWLQYQPTLYPAIPMTMQKIANIERAQLLIECDSRLMLQEFLKHWQPVLHSTQTQYKGLIRWIVDVDPLSI